MTNEEAAKELWAWKYSNTGCFHNMLFDLIQKADAGNIQKLQTAFPKEVGAYLDWCDYCEQGSSDGFFELHNLPVK